jgi:hypothetical protein
MRPGGAKDKGANGERQVAALMQPTVDAVYKAHGLTPPRLERNLEQVRRGGADLIGLDWLAVEVKWHKDRAIGAWWRQVLDAAKPAHFIGHKGWHSEEYPVCPCGATMRIPVLVYRGNNEPWRVVMFGYLLPMLPGVVSPAPRVRAPVDIPLEAFLAWLGITIAADLERQGYKKAVA